jgi:hypothetical protein
MDSLIVTLRACMHRRWYQKEVLALIAIYGQLGQLCIDPQYYNQHAATQSLTHALRARPVVEPQSCRGMQVNLRNRQNIDATDPTRKETRFPFHYHVTFRVC